MKIIQRVGLLSLALLFPLSIYADGCATCTTISNRDCGTCGEVMADVSQVPAEAYTAVSPPVNYMAAVDPVRRTNFFEGFFAGLGWGLGEYENHLRVGGINPFNLNSTGRSYLTARVNGGYAFVYCHFYLALELSYSYRTRPHSVSYEDEIDFAITTVPVGEQAVTVAAFPCDINLDIYSHHSVAADILPGFVFCRFLAFLRLGVEQTDFTWERSVCFPAVSLAENPTPPPTFFLNANDVHFFDSQTKTTSGFRVGAGIAIAAGQHVSFSLNYIHVFHNKIGFTPREFVVPTPVAAILFGEPATTTVDVSGLTAQNTIQPQRDEVFFGVTFTL